jgi:hypothetical protein
VAVGEASGEGIESDVSIDVTLAMAAATDDKVLSAGGASSIEDVADAGDNDPIVAKEDSIGIEAAELMAEGETEGVILMSEGERGEAESADGETGGDSWSGVGEELRDGDGEGVVVVAVVVGAGRGGNEGARG